MDIYSLVACIVAVIYYALIYDKLNDIDENISYLADCKRKENDEYYGL